MPRTKQTSLVDDKVLIKKLLEEQPNPIDTFKKYSYDEMKQALQDWLNPEDEAEEAEAEETTAPSDLPWETKTPAKKNYELKTPAKKSSKADKFDKLFEEEEVDSVDDDENDD